MKTRKRTITALDIGSSKTACIVCDYEEDGTLSIRSINSVASLGMQKGLVRDLNKLASSIDEAYSVAVYSSGVSQDEVYVSFGGFPVRSLNTRVEKLITNEGYEIIRDDVLDLMERAKPFQIEHEYSLVHSIVRYFAVDETHNIEDPVGMFGKRLQLFVHNVSVPITHLQNLERAVERTGLKVRGFVLGPIAAAEAVLRQDDKENGALLIDIGGGTTKIVFYSEGVISFTSILPLGASHFDQDLARGLNLPVDEAARLKRSFYRANPAAGEEMNDLVDIRHIGEREYSKMPRARVYEILNPRLEELGEEILKVAQSIPEAVPLPFRVVLTGGGALMRELPTYFSNLMGRPVRLGYPEGVLGLSDEFRTPQFASTIGLAIVASRMELESLGGLKEGTFDRVLDGITNFYDNILASFTRRKAGRGK